MLLPISRTLTGYCTKRLPFPVTRLPLCFLEAERTLHSRQPWRRGRFRGAAGHVESWIPDPRGSGPSAISAESNKSYGLRKRVGSVIKQSPKGGLVRACPRMKRQKKPRSAPGRVRGVEHANFLPEAFGNPSRTWHVACCDPVPTGPYPFPAIGRRWPRP